MENCYVLLGIASTASTEEIEEAYQRKKIEFGADALKQQELDSAYNEAIMGTFAPIRAFSSPLPPLTTGKKIPPVQQPLPVQQTLPVQSLPVEAPIQFNAQTTYAGPYTGASADPNVQNFVKEAPVSFSDAELMNMDVSRLRESYAPEMQEDDEETGFLISLGLENRLLRYYVKTYIAVAVFDMVMRLWLGPKWLVLTEAVNPDQMSATPALLSILFAFISIVYCFICALPGPFATRFFLLGQPPDKSAMMWSLFFLSVVSASLLRWLTGRFLPLNITGSGVSFMFAAMALSLGTLRYSG